MSDTPQPPEQYPPGQYPPAQYPPAQYPPAPYGAPGSWGNPFDGEATPILVTGILSLVVCGPIGIYAWVKGNDLRRRAESAGWPEPQTAKVGRILGIVGTVIGTFQVMAVLVWLVLFAGLLSAGWM